jgi:hypothetical protein
MEKVSLDIDLLKRMLKEAYEAGWHGSKELAEETAEEIVKNHESEIAKDGGFFVNTMPFTTSPIDNTFYNPGTIILSVNFSKALAYLFIF